MIVVDASVLANALADDGENGENAGRELRAAGEVAAPDLVDVETVLVLRKRWLSRSLTEQRFSTAIATCGSSALSACRHCDWCRVPSICEPTSAPTTPTTPATSRWPSTCTAN